MIKLHMSFRFNFIYFSDHGEKIGHCYGLTEKYVLCSSEYLEIHSFRSFRISDFFYKLDFFYTMHVTNFTMLNININYINKCYITLDEIYKNTCDV